MHLKQLGMITDSMNTKFLRPADRSLKVKSPLIVGFDLKYIPSRMLSYQFYTENKRGIVYPSGDDEPFDPEIFVQYLETFLGGQLVSDVYLISHDVQSDLIQYEDLENFELSPTSIGMNCKWKFGGHNFVVIDSMNFFDTEIDQIGLWLGVPVMSLNGIGGQSDNYWKEHMDQLLSLHKREFEEYAIRDAEIVYKAFVILRNKILKDHDVDILHPYYRTWASASLQIFRWKFLNEPITPQRVVIFPREKPNKNKTIWDEKPDNIQVFNGDYGVRRLSLEAYHGGRDEAFIRGHLKGDYSYYDVESLYPSSAMLQPLPLKNTKWHDVVKYFEFIRVQPKTSVLSIINGKFFGLSKTAEGNIKIQPVVEPPQSLSRLGELLKTFRNDKGNFESRMKRLGGIEYFAGVKEEDEDEDYHYGSREMLFNPSEMSGLTTKIERLLTVPFYGGKSNFLLILEDLFNQLQGFVDIEFEFPDSFLYPCLPYAERKKLYFPSKGRSCCTFSELRAALNFGASIEINRGYVFLPGELERDHPLKPYFQELFNHKKAAQKGTIDYQRYKFLMNALIGKFCQRLRLGDDLALIKNKTLSHVQSPKGQQKRKKYYEVGLGWAPEWASLIEGKSRSIMAEFIAKGTLFVSTDSVLLPQGSDINCPALEELRSIGSNLEKEYDIDELIIIKSRTYALYKNQEPVKLARHGASLPKDEFANKIKDALAGKPFDEHYTEKRRIKFTEACKSGQPLHKQIERQRIISLKWDGKRILENPDIDVFRQCSATKPIHDFPKSSRGAKQKELDIARIKKMRSQGMSIQRIAAELGESGATIGRRVKQLNLSKGKKD